MVREGEGKERVKGGLSEGESGGRGGEGGSLVLSL